jgi:hypothetical protein
MAGIADYLLSPFTAGLIGGVLTGMTAPSTRWNKFGPLIWFACWVVIFTAVYAFHSENPSGAIQLALGVAVFWSVIPFALTFFIGRFSATKLRGLFVAD